MLKQDRFTATEKPQRVQSLHADAMLAGNAYATTPPVGAIHCSRTPWMAQGKGGRGEGGTGKGQFRNNPLALHHTEAIVTWTLTEFVAIPA